MSTQTYINSDNLIAAPISSPEWFAVHTSCRHEKQVALHLASRGVEHLLPVYEETHRWIDRQTKVLLPVFPGYLFVRINLAHRLDVLTVPGVARLVGFQGGPLPVSASEIDAIRRGIASGLVFAPHPYLKAGCKVRVCRGPLAGVEGILVRTRSADRLVISVDLIMKSVALEIDAADVDVIS